MRRLLATLAAFVSLTATSCLSPTIPLPPPDQPDPIQLGATGEWTISGSCLKGAIVTVFDDTTGLGAVVEDRDGTGRYAISIAGNACDSVWVKQERDDDESARTPFILTEVVNGVEMPCK
jgi:hypothetical protein